MEECTVKVFPNFENPEKIYRTYQRYNIETKQFAKNKGKEFLGGIPLMYDVPSKCVVVDDTDSHTLVYGSTGSKKSRAVVMPAIKILGRAGESMIINDSKGELYNRHSKELSELNYNIIVINFRNPAIGNAWNPLSIPYEFYKMGDIDKASEFANDIANNLMRGETSATDPFWDYSASDLMFGLIMLLFRYASEHSKSNEFVNIASLIELRRTLFSSNRKAKDTLIWKYASEDEIISASLSGSVYAPNDTMNSILSVFDQKMRTFTIQPTLLNMLASNNIDIDSVGKQKTAIFLITPDEKKTYHRLVSLFVKQSYESIIYSASLNEGNRVSNRLNYILDEFSSLPAINDMPAMISAARSRMIRFLLIVQSKHQLEKRYKEEAATIISNCNNWIFLTSRELDLLRELSELCGEKANRTPNISVYDLQHLDKESNEAIVLCGRMKPAYVKLLDIDKYDGKNVEVLKIDTPSRQNREKASFELSQSIRQRLLPVSESRGSGEKPFNHAVEPSVPNSCENDKKEESSEPVLDIDELVKRIDAKIAQLEEEEAKERNMKNEAGECSAGERDRSAENKEG